MVTNVPPIAAVYQAIVPPVAEAVNAWVADPFEHTVWLPPLTGAAGVALIVKVTAVLERLEQVPLDDCA